MARKGNQQRNGVDRHTSNHKRKVSDSRRAPDMKQKGETSEVNALHGEEIPNGNQPTGLHKTFHAGDENKINENSGTVPREKKQSIDEVRNLEESVLFGNNSQDPSGEFPGVREENGAPISGSDRSGLGHLFNTSNIKSMVENVVLSGDMLRNLRASALSILQVVGEWMERHEPVFGSLKDKIYSGRDFVMSKIEKAYPIALKWLTQFGNIVLLLLMVWLDCTLRGIDSFLRLGTTSFFTVLWCTILSVIAMVGMSTFLIVLAIAAFVGVFIGLILGLLAIAIAGFIFLWSYGSFWTTLSLIVIGGLAFILSHERLALFITTVYSMYSVWSYLGWTGLLLALNLSFVTSDILIYFLKNNINQQRRSNRHADQSAGMEGRPGFFSGQSFHPSSPEAGTGASAERSSGAPSTSGVDAELTSEDEVTRLLNCTDHYSVLGLSRFENVDISLLKKEYRKKAMLVHPDKNMGNEKAAEAFKKLQNAYEVLIDSTKQKAYDDELRSEELLNYFRRFQSTSQKNGEHGFFASRFARSGADGEEDPYEESRRIACKKCGNFHLWFHTKKSKARARWCQDCKDFHQAKDGDGWVEQSSQPFLFGLLQKVDAPSAYVCADSKIYDATEWYICQGMRCPTNTHKPSFHVNTSVTSKHNSSKGSSSGQRSGQMPASNMEETMTEEELFEWLQNAMQSGVFENFNGSTSAESPTARAGNGPRSASGGSGSGSGSGSNNKKKKKGKKQW